MHYREEKIFGQGRLAAEDGAGPESNPYREKTNFHRYWKSGNESQPVSQTPVNHIYKLGDMVRPRISNFTHLPDYLTVSDIIDVPVDQIEFNPHIHKDFNDTGVGHSQWLIFAELDESRLVSGALVELIPEAPNLPGRADGGRRMQSDDGYQA